MKVGKPKRQRFALIQEEAGISMGISANLALAGQHAALTLHEQYQRWLKRDRFHAWGHYKREYFTVAVGGGNTVKAQYRAWLDGFSGSIDWLAHVRFFFLEETAGESGWESAEHALIMHFIVPLTRKLRKQKGRRSLARILGLDSSADEDDIIDAAVARLIHPINIAPVTQALEVKDRRKALRLARVEAQRYADSIRNKLGASMAFHCICSGIGKDGTLGAFSPYTPELTERQADTVLLKKDTGSLRIALSRGVLVNAEQIYLIVSGTHKLKALGRFEMEEATDFEQTVMETPLRMLRENREIAEKVYIFADEQALHFSETRFEFSERGQAVTIKAETRPGEEENGPHGKNKHPGHVPGPGEDVEKFVPLSELTGDAQHFPAPARGYRSFFGFPGEVVLAAMQQSIQVKIRALDLLTDQRDDHVDDRAHPHGPAPHLLSIGEMSVNPEGPAAGGFRTKTVEQSPEGQPRFSPAALGLFQQETGQRQGHPGDGGAPGGQGGSPSGVKSADDHGTGPAGEDGPGQGEE